MNHIKMKDEVEINIAEFFRKLLKLWLPMLVVAVICGAVTGGYMYYSDLQEAKKAPKQVSSSSIKELEETISLEDKNAVENTLWLRSFINKAYEYLANSPFMTVDAYDEKVVMNSFYISPQKLKPTDLERIHNSYIMYVKSLDFAEKFKEKMGWDFQSSYVSELIIPDDKFIVYGSGTEGQATSNILNLNVICPEDVNTNMEKIGEAVGEIILDYEVLDGKYAGKYNITRENSLQRLKMDQSTVDSQSSVRQAIHARESELETTEKELKGDAKTLYELYTKNEEALAAQAEAQKAKEAKLSPKMILLGFLLGILAFAVFIFIKYAYKPVVSKVTSVDTIIPLKYAGRISKDGHEVDEVRAVVDFKHSHSDNAGKEVHYVCWEDTKDEHKDIARKLAKDTELVEISVNSKYQTFKALEGKGNVVLILEEERTPIKRLRELVEILNENHSDLVAYIACD